MAGILSKITEGYSTPSPASPAGLQKRQISATGTQYSPYAFGLAATLKPVEVHHFCPRCNKICHKALFRVT